MSLCSSSTQSNLLRTVNGRMISPYSWGLKSPRRTSSQTFHMNDEISLWLTDISGFLLITDNKTQLIPELRGFYKNVGILLGSIICDSYYMTFFDSFLIVKLPPDIFYFSPSVSHRQ